MKHSVIAAAKRIVTASSPNHPSVESIITKVNDMYRSAPLADSVIRTLDTEEGDLLPEVVAWLKEAAKFLASIEDKLGDLVDAADDLDPPKPGRKKPISPKAKRGPNASRRYYK